MATTYKTPGVYIKEISKFPPSVAQVETAIPAFIGYTKKAKVGAQNFHADPTNPIIQPIRITSLLEYEQYFGATEEEGSNIAVTVTATEVDVTIENPSPYVMYYSLQGYFANGGGPCYIVSVGPTQPTANANIELGKLQEGLTAIEKEDEVTLIVFPESLSLIDVGKLADGDSNTNAGAYGDYKTLYDLALAQCEKLQDRFVVMDALLDIDGVSIFDASGSFRSHGIGTKSLKYGAAYGPRLKTIFDYLYDEAQVMITVPVPESDPPETAEVSMESINPAKQPEDAPPSLYGQYYPLVKSAIGREPVILPAAPLVVGIYAAVDNDRGVWKAPANVSVTAVSEPAIKISSEEQANLNLDTTGKSINAIRAFMGKGTLIWGARTLAGNDNEWRYVPVRRFFNMAEESIKKATEGFVFEPNDSNTWTQVRSMIENFLLLQWRAGALQGAKPDQAFFVNVGLNETMTALDILEGRMIVEIGMAVVRPAEFIILKFSHKMAES